MLDPNADYLTKDGAHRLAGHIRAYWARRGQYPHVQTFREHTNAGERWYIRSNMVGGRP